MTWTRGYVRSGDGLLAPHAALRRRPAFVIRDVARTLRTRLDEELREHGLTWVTFSLLLVTAEVDGLSQQALAERAAVDRNRVSAALAGMESQGLVDREPSRRDRRHTIVHLTSLGRLALAKGTPAVERAEREVLERLDADEREQLHALLGRLVRDDTDAWSKRF